MMNSRQITSLLRERCGRTFLGVFPIDRLPARLPTRRPLLLVCNTAKHDHRGKHWIVLFIDGIGKYFDSYAEPPMRAFDLYLSRYCNTYTTNTKAIQSAVSYSCGNYCVFYCLMKQLRYSMTDIENAFSSDTGLNDFIIHRFVCFGLK